MPEKLKLPFAPWLPDQAALEGELSSEALNVIPAARGFRSFPGPVEVVGVDALPARVLAALAVKDATGAPVLIAGTADKLYVRNGTDWDEKGTGLLATAGAPWSLAEYGETILAVNVNDDPQAATVASGSVGTFAAISGAPKARCVGVVRDFVFLGGLGTNRRAVQWCGIDDPTDWPTPGTSGAQAVQSDIQVFPVGGGVQAILGGVGGADGLIFLENRIERALYAGPPYIFQFDPVDKARGTVAPASVVNIGGQAAVFLAEDGFHMTNGAEVVPIGSEAVDLWFSGMVDGSRISEVRGVVDLKNKVVLWSFPTAGAAPGHHDAVLVFHYALKEWARASLSTECLFYNYATATTLEALDAVGTLDALPFSLDSRALVGGALNVGLFSPSHKLATLTGLPLAATLDTAEAGSLRFFVTGIRPLVDQGAASVQLLWRDLQGEDLNQEPVAETSEFDGVGAFGVSCRYARARVLIPAGAPWKIASGAELYYEVEGAI